MRARKCFVGYLRNRKSGYVVKAFGWESDLHSTAKGAEAQAEAQSVWYGDQRTSQYRGPDLIRSRHGTAIFVLYLDPNGFWYTIWHVGETLLAGTYGVPVRAKTHEEAYKYVSKIAQEYDETSGECLVRRIKDRGDGLSFWKDTSVLDQELHSLASASDRPGFRRWIEGAHIEALAAGLIVRVEGGFKLA